MNKMIQYGKYLLYLTVFAIVQSLIINGLINIPLAIILLDGLIYGSVYTLLGVFIWKVLLHGNFEALTIFQQLTNLLALGLISIIIWLSTSYILELTLFNKTSMAIFIPFLPTRAVIGVMSYLFIVQRFQLQLLQDRISSREIKFEEKEGLNQEEISIKDPLERVTVKSGTKIHVVEVPDILYLQAYGDYVLIHTTEGKYLKEQTMKYFEEQLPENKFVRVHRSIIVNIEMISRIELHEKQSQQLTLKNGDHIKTSVAGYKALKIALKL